MARTADVQDTARRAFVATLVVVAVVAATLALWELKLLIALVFLGFVIAAAMSSEPSTCSLQSSN